MEVEFAIPGGLEAPMRARHELRAHLEGGLAPELGRDLELLLSEIVTNAVRHGDAGPGIPVDVRIVADDDHASVCVRDNGRGFQPLAHPEPHFDRRPGGFGLFLLDRLSTRWGVERDLAGTRVWFELDRGA
jgi:anti-sigma regulatory factor (Ser/Thr protein kinase)